MNILHLWVLNHYWVDDGRLMVLEENELAFKPQRVSEFSSMEMSEASAESSLSHYYGSLKHLLLT